MHLFFQQQLKKLNNHRIKKIIKFAKKIKTMKAKNIVIGIFSILTLISCKNESDKKEGDQNQAELKETFDVNFNLTISKDDTFQLYYTEDGTLNFGDDRSVKSVVKGGETAQDVLFKLPADVLPTNIRLDFGENPEQGNVVVKSMKLKYLNNSYEKTFSPSDPLSHYFYSIDTQVKLNDATSTAEIVHPKGQTYDPLMWSNQFLSEEMVKIYKK